MSVDGPSATTSTFLNTVTHFHQRTLVDAGVLVRTLELAHAVDVHACITQLPRSSVARINDTLCINLVDDAATFRHESQHRNRAPQLLRYLFRQVVLLLATVEQPDVACSNPSRRGWRHRFQGMGSKRPQPTPTAWAIRQSDQRFPMAGQRV